MRSVTEPGKGAWAGLRRPSLLYFIPEVSHTYCSVLTNLHAWNCPETTKLYSLTIKKSFCSVYNLHFEDVQIPACWGQTRSIPSSITLFFVQLAGSCATSRAARHRLWGSVLCVYIITGSKPSLCNCFSSGPKFHMTVSALSPLYPCLWCAACPCGIPFFPVHEQMSKWRAGSREVQT